MHDIPRESDPLKPGEAPAIGTVAGDAMLRALRAVPTVLRSDTTRQALRENPQAQADRLGLPPQAGPVLLNIVHAAERHGAGSQDDAGERNPRDRGDMRPVLMQPFGHITWTFRILTAMSVTMFLVGVAFLVVALIRALREQDVSSTTALIAGVGLADLVLLFYRRPWEDINRGLSNSQQARIIATSYLSGVSMLRRDDPDVQGTLNTITRNAVELLEEFTEPPRAADG